MDAFFKKPEDTIPVRQRQAIEALTHRFGAIRADGERVTMANLDKFAKELAKELTERGIRPFFDAQLAWAVPLEKISSVNWNKAQERIYVDLLSLYRSLNHTFADDAYRGEVTREQFLKTRAAILRIINEMRLFQFLKSNPDYQDAKYVDFNAALNETERRPSAYVDPQVRLLELAPRAREIHSRRNFNLRSTKVDIEHIGGGRSAGMNRDHTPDLMLDSKPETFWAEMIMADEPIFTKYIPSVDGVLEGTELPGALAHITLTFNDVHTANTLRLLTFGEFPVRVVDVAYKEALGQRNFIQIPNFVLEEPSLDWVEINFDPRPIAQLRITIQQPNYRTSIYHLPERVVKNHMLWQHIGRTRRDETIGEISLTSRQEGILQADPAELIRLEIVDAFQGFLDGTELLHGRENQFQVGAHTADSATKALSEIDPGLGNQVTKHVTGEEETEPEKTVQVRTYEYVYGIREVQLQHNLYRPLGHYSSQKFKSTASILEVSMTTEERHPTFNDSLGDFHKTSVEWDIEVGRDRRFAIAPTNWKDDKGHIIVPDEHLQFDRVTRQAITRLPISSLAVTLRKNGIRMNLGQYTITKYSPTSPTTGIATPGSSVSPGFRYREQVPYGETDRGLLTITDTDEFDPNAVYTIQYVARDDADIVNVDEHLNSVELETPEVFESTNRNNQIVLRTFPYANYHVINSPKWTKEDGEARWRFAPSVPNYLVGTVNVTNGSINVVGGSTLWNTGIDATEPNLFRVRGDSKVYRIASVVSDTQITLAEAYEGATASTVEYEIGQFFETDSKLFALDRMVYEPVFVLVDDVKAINKTDYEAFEHNAFVEPHAAAGNSSSFMPVMFSTSTGPSATLALRCITAG